MCIGDDDWLGLVLVCINVEFSSIWIIHQCVTFLQMSRTIPTYTIHNRTRLTNFDPGSKVEKNVFRVYSGLRDIFLKRFKGVHDCRANKEIDFPGGAPKKK